MEAMATPQNDDDDGDIFVATGNSTLSNSLTTPIASRAIIQDVMTARTTPEASASLVSPTSSSPATMLREWAATPNMTPLQALPNISSPIPPVAPAVLLIQREESSTSTATVDATATRTSNSYQYPVATFVTNLVRSVSENVRGEIRDFIPSGCVERPQINIEASSAPRAILEAPSSVTTTNSDSNRVHSSNNDNDISVNDGGVPIMPAAQSQRSNGSNVADFEDDNQDWAVVNGDLVQLVGYSHEEYLVANESGSCSTGNNSSDVERHSSKSSRMHRSLRKIKKIITGRNSQRRRGDRSKSSRGESARRRQSKSHERERYQQENPNHSSSLEFRNYDSTDFIDGGVGDLSISDAPRVRRDTASDDDNESGDGGSLIVAPNALSLSHQTTVTMSSNNNSNAGDNSTISTNRFHSEDFSIRTGSLRSTGTTNNLSPHGTNSSQGQKKKSHLIRRWLRGTGTDSSSSSRSKFSAVSSGSGSSVPRLKKHKLPHSPSNGPISQQYYRDSSATKPGQNRLQNISDNDSDLTPGRTGLSPAAPMMDGKPAALEPRHAARGSMPPLREISQEYSSGSLRRSLPPSLMAESPLHASSQNDFQRSTSIAAHASFVGHSDSITSEAALLPHSEYLLPQSEYYIEDRLDEYDKYDEKNMKGMKSSMKADKHMGPSIDMMLERAGEIAKDLQDEDAPLKLPPSPAKSPISKGKSDGESVPLSMAYPGDEAVHNDILKLVLVGDCAIDKSGLGRALRKSSKKPRQRTRLTVDVHSWVPPNADVRFTIWEVIASKSEDPYLPNFGARPGTQSLFFSDQSLYLLVYDLGASNPETLRRSNKANEIDSDDEYSDDEWDEHENAYLREEANRKADRALEADIKERVLSWVDCIARIGTNSAILPIALLPSDMSTEEAERRLHVMKTVILNYEENLPPNTVRPKILIGEENDVVWVSLDNNINVPELEQMILDIVDASHNVFHHVGRSVPAGTVEIMKACRDLKKTHKMILVDHLIAKLPKKPEFSTEAVMEVLYFLSTIGEVLYFGGSDSMLKDYVILCRKWLVGALSCILRNDLQRELAETRQFFQFQTFYSDQQFPESHVTQTFWGTNSSCPILSHQDTQMLWQSTNFMMEAVDQSSQNSETLTTTSTMFDFLQHLLEHSGVFLPLEIDPFSSTDRIYFVPSLLSQASSRDVWTYKSSESWMVTLCHSWLFRDGAPAGLMEQVTVALLRDLYESSRANAEIPTRQGYPPQPNNNPFGQSSMNNSPDSHDGEPIGQIKIHQINCWKNSLLVNIGRVFPRGGELKESKIEIFVAVTDQVSTHSVASDVMRSNMQRLVVSGKGEVGLHGQKLWKGGYNIVLDSIKASVANCTNVERQVVCPECLAHRPACSANTWSWDSVLTAPDHTVRCMMGHRADRNMICGIAPPISTVVDGRPDNANKKPLKDLFPSVVIVGLLDNETKTIQDVGSGFIANKKLGLVVTASHTLFNMERGRGFGAPYKGLRNASVVVGVIPSEKKNETSAVFRYVAQIVADDIHNMDACILQITRRLENDVHNHLLVGEQTDRILDNIQEESLVSLKITKYCEIEQTVRIIGFNQGGEGRLERGKHVNRTLDFALGYICKHFRKPDDESSSSDDSSSSEEGAFEPRAEIVVMCSTIEGHSGGPCVNDDGKVVGILSRVDPVDRQRCYLVPSSEIKKLINKAKNRVQYK